MNLDGQTVSFTDISRRKAAVITGLGLLIMTIIAPVANFIGIQKLIEPGNAAKTTSNILASEGLFCFSIFSFFIVLILDVVVAWGLYILLKPVSKNISLLSAWFRLVYAAILGSLLVNLLEVSHILSNPVYLKAFGAEQLNAQVMLLLNTFNNGWDVSFLIFGLHLFVLGYLILKADYFPRLLGILVIIASAGYLVDSTGKIIYSNYNLSVAMYTFVGEVILMVYLIWKGIKGFD